MTPSSRLKMMDRKLQEGYDKLRAATFAYTSTAFPMLTGTLITVACSLPVGFAASQAGEYVSALFWVAGVALVSLVVCGGLLHALDRLPAAQGAGAGYHGEAFDLPPFRIIRAVVAWCVRWRKTVVVMTVGALAASIASFAFIPQQFFPYLHRQRTSWSIGNLLEGTSFADTEREAKAVEARLCRIRISPQNQLRRCLRRRGGAARLTSSRSSSSSRTRVAQLMLMSKSLQARGGRCSRCS